MARDEMMKQNEITYISHCRHGKISQESAESLVTYDKLYEKHEIQKAINDDKTTIIVSQEMLIDELKQEIRNYKICFGLICALSIFVAVVSNFL
jgi:bisphosphoglycerate-dependent phosphoglycerate mutase